VTISSPPASSKSEPAPRRCAASRSAALILLGLLATAVPERADAQAAPTPEARKAAARHYRQGQRAYDLGHFDEAIQEFERAYVAVAAPELLFNIALAHRQLGHCTKAVFFFRRFAANSPESPKVDEARSEGDRLAARCPEPTPPGPDGSVTPAPDGSPPAGREGTSPAAGPAAQPPDGPPPAGPQGASPAAEPAAQHPDGSPPAGPQGASPDSGPAAHHALQPPPPEPHRAWVVLDLQAGVGLLQAGDLDAGVQPSFRLSATLPVAVGPVELRFGALGGLLPVPLGGEAGGGTALQTHALGQFELALHLVGGLSLRAEAGGGVLIFSGLGAGNPFTVNGAPTSGPLSMLALRGAVGLELALHERVRLVATPFGFWFSPPKAGLDPSIHRLTRMDFTLGIALRL
jgi:hypothetical protein